MNESVQLNHAAALERNSQEARETKRVKDARTFYSSIAGCSYYFKDGSRAVFAGGSYTTDREFEIKELESLIKQDNALISEVEVPIQNISDAIIVRDVKTGQAGQTPVVAAQSTGMMSSAQLAALAELHKK